MKSARTVAVAPIILGLVVWASAGYAQEKGKGGSDAIAQLYAAAKKEGTVVIWGPTDAIIYQRMQEALDKQYPGIKIEHFESIPEPFVQRIIAESQAGKPAAVDIIQSGSLRALRPLIDRDMLAPYSGWEKILALTRSMPASVCRRYNLTSPIAYNTKMVSAQEAPKSWEDLADAKWKGRKSSSKRARCPLRCSAPSG
jgi:iron(III) transport system substrate-binding protein